MLEWFYNTPVEEIQENNKSRDCMLGLFYSICILLPMSIPRQINSLCFISLIGTLCTLYLGLALTGILMTEGDERLIPTSSYENLSHMKAVKFSFSGMTGTFPIIIFSYMYQI